jgi:hypothetical protein
MIVLSLPHCTFMLEHVHTLTHSYTFIDIRIHTYTLVHAHTFTIVPYTHIPTRAHTYLHSHEHMSTLAHTHRLIHKRASKHI